MPINEMIFSSSPHHNSLICPQSISQKLLDPHEWICTDLSRSGISGNQTSYTPRVENNFPPASFYSHFLVQKSYLTRVRVFFAFSMMSTWKQFCWNNFCFGGTNMLILFICYYIYTAFSI